MEFPHNHFRLVEIRTFRYFLFKFDLRHFCCMALLLLLFAEPGHAQITKQVSPGASCEFEIMPVPGGSYYWTTVEKRDLKEEACLSLKIE